MSVLINKDEVIRLIKMGWTYSMIAEELKTNRVTVCRIAKESGVTSGYKTRARVDRSEEDIAKEKYFRRLDYKPPWGPDYGIPPEEED